MKRVLLICALALLLTACNFDVVKEPIKMIISEFSTEEADSVYSALDNPVASADNIIEDEVQAEKLALYIEDKNYSPGKFEPPTGCLAGAYVTDDYLVGGSIRCFENLCLANHAVYVIKTSLSEAFPESEFLECVSLNKTPCIVIEPPEEGEPFDYEMADSFIIQASELDLPAFYMPYPYSSKYEQSADYQEFFRYFSAELNSKLYHASVIWTVNCFDYDTAEQFYPGDDYADWVGISVQQKLIKNYGYLDPYSSIDKLYAMFSDQKPIWLNIGIGHYSLDDNKYYIEEKSAELTKLYASIEKRYKRIKCVVYEDSPENSNCLLTEDESIMTLYASLVNSVHFLPDICTETSFSEYFLFEYPVYRKGDEILFPVDMLTEEPQAKKITKSEIIGGLEYIKSSELINIVQYDFYEDLEDSACYITYN